MVMRSLWKVRDETDVNVAQPSLRDLSGRGMPDEQDVEDDDDLDDYDDNDDGDTPPCLIDSSSSDEAKENEQEDEDASEDDE